MSPIRFSMDQFNLPLYHVDDKKFDALGEWVTTDVSRFFLVCLDALAMADDVANGRPPFEEWSSENYEVTFTPQSFRVTNLWVPGAEGEYPVDEVREVIEEYWRFLVSQPERDVVREYRPDLPEWEANLLRWEEKWERTHPYRGRFF